MVKLRDSFKGGAHMALKTNRKKIAEGLTKSASNAKGAITEAAGAVKGKAVVAAGAAGTAISSGAATASEKAARAIRDQKERLYNPLFAEDYFRRVSTCRSSS